MDKNKELSFEESLKELENIVDQLESGDIDLEKSVKLYEKGMLLKKKCENKLKNVEMQIKKIKLQNNVIVPRLNCDFFKTNYSSYKKS